MWWIGVVIFFQLILLWVFLAWGDSPRHTAEYHLLRTRSPSSNESYSPTASPTFIVPVVVLYLSRRAVRGDFAGGESPEAVCEEGAHELYGCDRVSALITTAAVPLRRRVRHMKDVMVSFEHDNHIVAHDVSEVWTGLALGLHQRVWTGTDADGGVGEDRCKDWTSTEGYGVYGSNSLADGDAACSESLRLLCVCSSRL